MRNLFNRLFTPDWRIGLLAETLSEFELRSVFMPVGQLDRLCQLEKDPSEDSFYFKEKLKMSPMTEISSTISSTSTTAQRRKVGLEILLCNYMAFGNYRPRPTG